MVTTSRTRVLTTVHLCVTSLGGINFRQASFSSAQISRNDNTSDIHFRLKFCSLLVILQVLLCFSTQSALNSNVESLWRKGQTDSSADALVIVYRRTTSDDFEFLVKNGLTLIAARIST